MKYIKDYYDGNDYKDILNYFFRLFKDENFLNFNSKEYYNIFKNSFDKILNQLVNNKIKSDKKLFSSIRKELLYLINNNDILKKEIERHKIYLLEFKENNYYNYTGSLNYNYFRLKINPIYL